MSIITDLHRNICKALRETHPNVYVDVFPEIKKSIKLPAVFVEMSEMRPGTGDTGTEQLSVAATFEARCMIDMATHGHMAARELAASVAYQVYRHGRFDVPVMPAKIASIGPDHLSPDIDAYIVWMVEWTHQMYLGDNLWDTGVLPREIHLGPPPHKLVTENPEGVVVPHEIWASIEPLVGEKYKDYYEKVWSDGR
jgi:hypothetical protein